MLFDKAIKSTGSFVFDGCSPGLLLSNMALHRGCKS